MDLDDYFDDNLVLDENDLAVLQQAEEKYLPSLPIVQEKARQPPAKRQKTAHQFSRNARSATDSNSVIPEDESEPAPEIFLRSDGTYGVRGEIETGLSSIRSDNPTVLLQPPSETLPELRPLSSIRPPRPDTAASPPVVAQVRVFRSNTPKPTNGTSPTVTNGNSASERQLQLELEALRKQNEELRQAKISFERSLKEALDARYTKEGEVIILRKGMEKVSQEHAADISRLKAAKEQAETMKIQMQKEMKDEMERLRTQFIFKQHEVEMSARKPIWSVRSKKSAQAVPPTPVSMPPDMMEWRKGSVFPRNELKETPIRPRGRNFKSPQSSKANNVANPFFPGLDNSFLPSSPTKSPTRKTKRLAQSQNAEQPIAPPNKPSRKGKEKDANIFGGKSQPPPRPAPEHESPRNDFGNADIDMSDASPIRQQYGRGSSPEDGLGDVSIGMDDETGDVELMSDGEDFEGLQWRDELHRILFTHTTKGSSVLTLHLLLSTSLPPSTAPPLPEQYQSACTGLLDALGRADKDAGLDEFMFSVANSLLCLAGILLQTRIWSPLVAVLDLLNTLSLFVSSFNDVLLQVPVSDDDPTSSLMLMLCELIQDHLEIRKEGQVSDLGSVLPDLSHVVMALLETVCWSVPGTLSEWLVILTQNDRVLSALLDTRQPPPVIARTIRVVVLLASHPSLSQQLLSFPHPEVQDSQGVRKANHRIPLIDGLCAFLMDPTLLGSETKQSLSSILAIFALLSISQPETLTLLLESASLIPALVHFLAQLTSLLWEEDDAVMKSTAMAYSTVCAVVDTLHLLHHLIFTPKPTFDLRLKLHYADNSHRQFNGLSHMFIVMIGRLSCADPPDWLEEAPRLELERLVEPARDLMELIVEGPEEESVWRAYGKGDDQTQIDEDDEETEARRLNANEVL
ncbi:hypothetical protein BD410DRAFT_784364 [Rickenella mellea]|uniref:Uncharacterized protein n=1 Tax=Rickenella mellea TaxID=50990 RepID=A0A4Y7QFZ8_9AGAM|nr:hypothetical protein BD410DRAFT_784364 [Rickenella mellea]